jgi:hypothetical protein
VSPDLELLLTKTKKELWQAPNGKVKNAFPWEGKTHCAFDFNT